MGAALDIIKLILWLVVAVSLFIGWFWVVRTCIIGIIFKGGNYFVCKKCHKKISRYCETEKKLCKWCKERIGG